MAIETTRSEAHQLIDKLTDVKLAEAFNYLKFLEKLPEDQIDLIEDLMESLGWSILASEVAKEDWE